MERGTVRTENGPTTGVGLRTEGSGKSISLALVGPPHVGKSALFNLLNGFSQRSRIWPGTTVEIRTGTHRRGDRVYEIVELPSVYSLTANSPDDQVAQDYLLRENPDAVVVVVSALNLERGFYLVTELLELPLRVVVAVNMMDVASKSGIRVDETKLQIGTGMPVVTMTASRGQGTTELLDAVDRLMEESPPQPSNRLMLEPRLEAVADRLEGLLDGITPSPYSKRWLALKLLEGDGRMATLAQESMPPNRWEELETVLSRNDDAAAAVANARYDWVGATIRPALFKPSREMVSLTERLDRVATHPHLGPLLLAGVLAFFFWLVYQVAEPTVGLFNDAMVGAGGHLREALGAAPSWVADLLVDGVLAGVGAVVSLLPILIVFFLGISALQQVGYTARAAFVADRFMRMMGLHGLSLVPLFLGFGCNVSAVLGARLVDSERARLLTVLLAPIVPCSGRMVLLVYIASVMFGRSAPFIIWGLVALNLVLLVLTGILFDRTVLRSERPPLIMELPPYHLPNWRATLLETWQNAVEFLVRAGTVILIFSMAIWVLAYLPSGSMGDSYLARMGRYLEPLGGLMGLDWRMMVALLTSFLARKESALATLGVLSAGGSESGLVAALPTMLTPASALAYLVLQMVFIPCASTLAAVLQQTRSWRWTSFGMGYLLILSLVAGIATYQAARLLNWGL